MIKQEHSNQESQLNQMDSYIINKNSPYYIDEKYFEEIMVDLGSYITKKYSSGYEVEVDELMSKIAYINDLTIQQKMSFALFFGKYLQNKQYEEFILSCKYSSS
jgi:hypothetical protein